MTRLPPALMPLWPLAKRAHRAATRGVGAVGRRLDPDHPRAVPRRAEPRSARTAQAEPDSVRLVPLGSSRLEREVPLGEPAGLRFWDEVTTVASDRYVLEVADGRLVGEAAATVTPGGVLDLQTSPYFGTRSWREHPLYLRPRLPEPEEVEGTVVSLASHGSARNYYHALMDTLPRWGLFRQVHPDLVPEVVVVGHTTRWDAQLVAMAGIGGGRLVEPTSRLALRAERLVVPAVDNSRTLAPPWITAWLRDHLAVGATAGLPRRIYVTRGGTPNTRRYLQEDQLLPHLERQGFTRIDPGALTVQEQIDHFAAAEVVVAPHGAGLVNLNFAPAGVRVLELFAPTYLNPGYWSITSNVPESSYRYLVAEPVDPDRPERRMQGVQDDVDLAPSRVLDSLEQLLAAPTGHHRTPHSPEHDRKDPSRSAERGTT